jgi:hypothetical protein
MIFGFRSPIVIMKDEFSFFLDCLFRGLSKIAITKNSSEPDFPNKRLDAKILTKIVEIIFQ